MVKKSRGSVLRRSTSFLERMREANCSMTLRLAMMTLEKTAIVLAQGLLAVRTPMALES